MPASTMMSMIKNLDDLEMLDRSLFQSLCMELLDKTSNDKDMSAHDVVNFFKIHINNETKVAFKKHDNFDEWQRGGA